MKTKLLQLELMKQSYIKKLVKIENEISKIKENNIYDEIARIS